MALAQEATPASSTGTITATPALTALGSLLLVFIGMSGLTESVATATDNAGNTYTNAYDVSTGSGGRTVCYYCIGARQTSSIVVTFSASTLTKNVIVREYSGYGSGVRLDRSVSASGSGTAVTTGASSAIRDAPQLVVCSAACLGTTPTLAAGSGFANFTSQAVATSSSVHAVEDSGALVVGSQTGTMTAGGTSPLWDVGLASFWLPPGRFTASTSRPRPFAPGLAR